MPTVRIQEKNYSESIMVLKLKDGDDGFSGLCGKNHQKFGILRKIPLRSVYNLTFRVRW